MGCVTANMIIVIKKKAGKKKGNENKKRKERQSSHAQTAPERQVNIGKKGKKVEIKSVHKECSL